MIRSNRGLRRTVHKAIVDSVIAELQHLPDRTQKQLLENAADQLLAAIAGALAQGHQPDAVKQMLSERGIQVSSLP